MSVLPSMLSWPKCRRGDVVLELGSGLGVASALAARFSGCPVTTYEGDAAMAPFIARVHAALGLSEVIDARTGFVDGLAGETQFHRRDNFYASSAHPTRAKGSAETVRIPTLALHDEILRVKPSVLIVDVEGSERTLFEHTDLPGVRAVIIEMHPDLDRR